MTVTIQRKLLIAFLALSGAALVAAVIGTNWAVRQAAKEKMSADLVTAVKEFQHQVESLESDLELAAEASLSQAEILRTYAGSNDDQNEALGLGGSSDESLNHAHDLARSADLKLLKRNDLLVMVNARGRLFYSLADESQLNQDLSEVPIIKAALAGGPVKDLWSTAFVRSQEAGAVKMLSAAPGQALFVVYAAPYRRAGQIYGAVVIGKRVKTSLLQELERTARARVVLRARDDMAVSTLDRKSVV